MRAVILGFFFGLMFAVGYIIGWRHAFKKAAEMVEKAFPDDQKRTP